MKIRLKFEKQGILKFIGHLDVMRTFQKINRRAHLDITYSTGFSPHQEMSFATPLGLGLTSNAEYVDISFNSVPSKDELIRIMNEASVPELRITDACLLPEKAKNAMSLLAAADYTLTFREEYKPEDIEAFFTDLDRYLSQEVIMATKETKTKTVETDIRSQIRAFERRGEQLFFRVDTGSASNLKPDHIMKSFYEWSGREWSDFVFMINRDELYGEEEGKLKKLSDYGVDF